MPRFLRYALFPTALGLAAFFTVLPQTGADATIEMHGASGEFRFDPAALRIQAGDRVEFANESGSTHTATCDGCRSDAWDTGDVQPGQSVLLTFSRPGTYTYSCRYHGRLGLTGSLGVGSAAPAAASPSPTPTLPAQPVQPP